MVGASYRDSVSWFIFFEYDDRLPTGGERVSTLLRSLCSILFNDSSVLFFFSFKEHYTTLVGEHHQLWIQRRYPIKDESCYSCATCTLINIVSVTG